MIQFRNRHVELPPQLIFQAANHLSLVLQRLRVRDVQLKGEQADGHDWLQERCYSLFSRPWCAALCGCIGSAEFRHLETLQNVADLDVVEVRDAHAALKAGANLTGVVLEALQ